MVYKFYKIKIHHWPVITSVWFILTFIISYAISVAKNHVYAYFPFISDTGAIPPESCVFGQMLNIAALFLAILLYLRHRQIKNAYEKYGLKLKPIWNKSSKWFAIFATIGTTMVANFQENNLPEMHFLGAIFAFGFGSIYFILQTRISYALYRKQRNVYSISTYVLALRTFLALWMLPFFFATLGLGTYAFSLFDGSRYYYWTPQNAGYGLHLGSTICEWLLALFYAIYMLTFTNEFRSMKYQGLQINHQN